MNPAPPVTTMFISCPRRRAEALCGGESFDLHVPGERDAGIVMGNALLVGGIVQPVGEMEQQRRIGAVRFEAVRDAGRYDQCGAVVLAQEHLLRGAERGASLA